MKVRLLNLNLALWCAAALAVGFVHNSMAQDSHWAGTTTNNLWSNPNNWNPVGVPPPGDPVTPFQGNVWLDAANGDTVITIAAGDVENPGVGNTTETFNTIFGPEWGVTLNIYGTLNFDWILYPVQWYPAPGFRSYVNLYDNAVVSTHGAAIGIGDSWWYHEGCFVTMNLYSNAQYNSFGGAGLWLGGHLNIYDNASFLVNGYINMDFTVHQNDGTRSIVLGGGKLILPQGYIAGTNTTYNGGPGNIYSFIARGIVRAYGKGLDTNDLVITDDGTNTYVVPVPLGGALQRVYFQPLPHASVAAGTFQQATLVGDYPGVSGVLLSSSEPGVSPTSFAAPVYTSSDPTVATVDANGMVTAVNAGHASLTAKVGALNTTNTLTVNVVAGPTLIHEYKFSETSGTTAADSVPGNSPTWDGSLVGGATLGGGKVTLDGTTGYITLPGGIVSSLDEVTIEAWASFDPSLGAGANLFAFGNTDPGGNGQNYINFQPHTLAETSSANFGMGDPGNAAETDATAGPLTGQTNIQIVVVYHPSAGYLAFYTNGVFAANNTALFNNLIDPIAFAGPTYNSQSVLSYTLGGDPLNYIGASLYSTEPMLNGSVDEFRIYSGPMTPSRIQAEYALGPDQLIGTSTQVSLTVTHAGGNLVLNWPTSSALVTLMSSPTLGPGAVWTPVLGNLTASAGAYHLSLPAAAGGYYRLQL